MSTKPKKKNQKKPKSESKPPQPASTQSTGGLSGLDAACKVLSDAKEPLDSKTIVERALSGGLWQTSGKTPAATIYAAMIREIAQKGETGRFVKVERGKFALRS